MADFIPVPILSEEATIDEYEAREAALVHNAWEARAAEAEAAGNPPCEHGLSAWLCEGPSHYA